MMTVRKGKELMTVTLERAIELYISTLATEGKSPRYLDWLKTRLKFFIKFIQQTQGDNFLLQDLAIEDGREFLRELLERDRKFKDHPMHPEKKGKLSIQYIHGCGRAVRSFSTWVYEEGYLDDNVMQRLRLPKLPTTLPEPLNEQEIRLVLSTCLETTHERRRNFAIMMLFLDTGLRLDELVNLRLSRIDFPLGEMTVTGKGSKERKVPVGSQAKKALLEYISKERREPSNPMDADYLFISADGQRITHTAVAKVFQRVKEQAGVPKLHPHVCRHTFSVRYLVNGRDAFSLQKILGHTTLEMTRKYVNMAFGEVKVKHRQFSPMDNLGFQTKKRGRPAGR